MSCKYTDIFGKPDQGVHSYRIANIAIVDVIMTLIGAYLLNIYLPNYSFLLLSGSLFIVGIILHRLFCVETTIDKLLFS